eukprot:scaffold3389_cov119-Cylindrotheca_fusiformis.AAC.6
MKCHEIWSSLFIYSSSHALLTFTNAQDVLEQYEIGQNRMRYYSNKIDLYFPVNSMVADGTAAVVTFSDSDCSESIVGNDYLVPEIAYDDNYDPNGLSNREIKVQYTINYEVVEDSPVYTSISDGESKVDFCVSFILLSGVGGQPISAIDTEISVLLKWDDTFGEEVNVGPTGRDENLARESYTVEGFLCDDNNEKIKFRVPKSQGSVTKICVKPTEDALAADVYMRRIDSFSFQRAGVGGVDGELITQDAIADGQTLPLTEMTCIRAGTVHGFGEAWLQFGRGNSRRLQIRIEAAIEAGIDEISRSLTQIDGGNAGTSYIDIDIFVLPPENSTYHAEAFECDQWNHPVPEPEPKTTGMSVRVCVVPDEEARKMGIRIYGIESWNFTRDEFTQEAVEYGGIPAADGLTIISCVPGSTICSFKTEFIREFYDVDSAVQGVGTVLLQYSFTSPTLASQRRLHSSAPTLTTRHMQEVETLKFDQVVAGRSNVGMETPVAEKIQLEGPCEFDHEATEWWIDQDINDRYMYIAILVGSLIGVCCLLLCCWLLPPLCPRDQEEQEVKNQNVKVNVDLNSEQTENQNSKLQNVKSLSKRLFGSFPGTTSSGDGVFRNKLQSRAVPHGGVHHAPTDDDVCFDQKSHPGTRNFRKVVKQVAREIDEEYSPVVYKAINKRMSKSGSRFFFGKGPYHEPGKNELFDRIGSEYTNALNGMSSNGSLRSKDSKTQKGKKGRKTIDRASTVNSLSRSVSIGSKTKRSSSD